MFDQFIINNLTNLNLKLKIMIIIYHNPRCSKSREALKILQEKNCEIEIIEYLKTGIEIAQIEKILDLLALKPLDIIRKNETEFKEQNLDATNLLDQDLILAIHKTPKLLQRPIIINGQKAIIARPPQDVLQIL